MHRKRDYIEEILSAKSRLSKRSDRWTHYIDRAALIYRSYEHLKKDVHHSKEFRLELLRYIPIGLVACIQGYFRLVIRDIIDHGLPYQNNVNKLKDIKYDPQTVLAIFKKKISLGDFVSHLLLINSLKEINKYMSILLDLGFLKEVVVHVVRNSEGRKLVRIGSQADFIFASIEKIFEFRHIFSHELCLKMKPKLKETEDFLNASIIFVHVTESFIDGILSKKHK